MRKRPINIVLILVALALILLTLIPLFLSYYVGPRVTRQILQQQVATVLQRNVEVDRAGITIFGGFGIECTNLRILEVDGQEVFRVDTFLLKPWIKSLIFGRLKWKRIVLKNPAIHIIRTADGHLRLNAQKGEGTSDKEARSLRQFHQVSTHLPSQLFVRGGRVRFTDFGQSQKPLVTEWEDIELTCHDISPGRVVSFRLTGRFAGDSKEEFSISSKVMGMGEPFDRDRLEFDISLKANGIDFQRLWPYVRSTIPADEARGLFDLDVAYRGGLTCFHSAGEIRIRNGEFTIPAIYTATVEPKEISLAYDLEYEKQEIRVSQLVFRLPHVSIQGHGSVHKATDTVRSIAFEFATGRTSLRDIGPLLPDGLIPEQLRPLLADRRVEGFIQVEKARLEGPWADFTPEGLRKTPHMLSIRTRLEGCSLPLDPKLPPIQNISGIITLEGDRAEVSEFQGEFLHSHLRDLQGSISDIYSNPAIAATFKGDLDLKALRSLLKVDRIAEELRKTLEPISKISGKATMAGEIKHRFNKPSDLTYKGQISMKRCHLSMAGFPLPFSNIEGKIRFDEKEILLSGFKWKMGTSLCRGDASLRDYTNKTKGNITLSKNPKIAFYLGVGEIVIDHLLSKGGKAARIRADPKSIWVNSTISGKVRISRGSFKGFRFDNFASSFSLIRGRLKLRKFQAEVPRGFVTCRGWINLRSRQGVSFKLIPTIHRLEMSDVLSVFMNNGNEPVLSGKLDLDGIIAGSGDSLEKITRSLRGDLRLRGTDGAIYGIERLKGKPLPYTRAVAQVGIQKGIARTEDLCLDSDAISLIIRGQADLNHQTFDIDIGVRPLQTLDKIISNVPVAGWLLAGKDRSILTFSYRLKGRFDDLRVVK